MTLLRRTAVLALAGVLMLTGCGDDSPGAGTGDDDDLGLPVITVTFDVEGEETLKGSVTERSAPAAGGKTPQTCEEYADGGTSGGGTRYLPLPLQLGGQLGDRTVGLEVRVRDYKGPGTYTEESLSAEGVAFGLRVGDRPYVRQGDSGSVVTVKADGSGEFSFERLAHSTGADVSPGISGMVSWTCRNG